jgi:hypothetical protein
MPSIGPRTPILNRGMKKPNKAAANSASCAKKHEVNRFFPNRLFRRNSRLLPAYEYCAYMMLMSRGVLPSEISDNMQDIVLAASRSARLLAGCRPEASIDEVIEHYKGFILAAAKPVTGVWRDDKNRAGGACSAASTINEPAIALQ